MLCVPLQTCSSVLLHQQHCIGFLLSSEWNLNYLQSPQHQHTHTHLSSYTDCSICLFLLPVIIKYSFFNWTEIQNSYGLSWIPCLWIDCHSVFVVQTHFLQSKSTSKLILSPWLSITSISICILSWQLHISDSHFLRYKFNNNIKYKIVWYSLILVGFHFKSSSVSHDTLPRYSDFSSWCIYCNTIKPCAPPGVAYNSCTRHMVPYGTIYSTVQHSFIQKLV